MTRQTGLEDVVEDRTGDYKRRQYKENIGRMHKRVG